MESLSPAVRNFAGGPILIYGLTLMQCWRVFLRVSPLHFASTNAWNVYGVAETQIKMLMLQCSLMRSNIFFCKVPATGFALCIREKCLRRLGPIRSFPGVLFSLSFLTVCEGEDGRGEKGGGEYCSLLRSIPPSLLSETRNAPSSLFSS